MANRYFLRGVPAAVAVPVPTLTAGALSSTQIQLTATYSGPPTAATYTFEVATASGGPWTTLGTQAASAYMQGGLSASTTLYYRVAVTTAETPARNSAWSTVRSATTTGSGSTYKFNPGDYMMPPQYGGLDGATVDGDLSWIKIFATYPCKGYVMQRHLSDLDQGSSIDNNTAHAVAGTGNFVGFTSQIGAIFNLHQTYNPGAHFGLYVNTIEQWGSPYPTGSFTSPVPNYLMHCGGSISIPNFFGSSSSTAYTLYESSNSTCGVGFYAYNSPSAGDYGFLEAAWWDPAVRAVARNVMQALALYELPTATAYNSGTAYAQGTLVTSGGLVYCSIFNGANTGQAVTNTTYWKLSSNAYAGQTLNECELVEFIGNNDETSATFNEGPAVPGSTTSANVCSYQNYYTGYLGHLQDKQAAFPNTMVGGCLSYVITGTTGEQDASTWTGYIAELNAVTGISFSQADMHVNQFTPGSGSATNAMIAYVGLNPDASYGGTYPAFGSYSGGTNYVGVMPALLQVQPEDYPGGASPTNVNELITSMGFLNATHRFWSPEDEATFSHSTWGATIQPTFTAGTAVTSTRPSNLP
jgi:hypothetical protein